MSPGVEDYEDFEASLGPGQLDDPSQQGTAHPSNATNATEAGAEDGRNSQSKNMSMSQKSSGLQADSASLKSDLLNQSGVKAAQWQNKTLGNYRLARVLGDGGMGIVFQAEDVNLHRTVALKVLRRRIKDSRENKDVELFLREARGAASLDHPNIVRIFQIDQHKGWWYIAMEYLEGGSLMNLVKSKGPLEPSRAAMLIADAANGLTEAHANGIVHRDIKPANLMLTRKGTCKVADFGLVKMDDPNDPFRLNSTPVGTPVYIAPEIVMQKVATPASDIYSLSATLFTVLTARPPFKGKTRKDFLEHALKTPPPDLRESAPHCSQILGDLIKAGMNKDPKARPNAKAFAATLRSEISASLALEAASQHSSMIMSMPSSAALRSQASGFVLQSHASGIIHPDLQKKEGFRLPLVVTTAAVGALIVLGVVYMGLMLARMQNQIDPNYEARLEEQRNAREIQAQALKKERDDMIGIKADALSIWRKAQKIESGPGTTDLLESAAKHFTIADEHEKAENYYTAAEEYDLLKEKSGEILRVSQKRDATIKLKANADKLVAEGIALGVEKMEIASVQKVWTEAVEQQNSTDEIYKRADFEAASEQYAHVSKKLDDALALVREWKTLQEIQDSYSEEEKRIQVSFLNEYGIEKWSEVKALKQQALALISEENPTESSEVYQKAMAMLPEAEAEAKAHLARKELELKLLKERKLKKLLSEANHLAVWQTGKLSLPLIEEALKESPDNKAALALRRKVASFYKPGKIVKTASEFDLAYIPDGEFIMGSPASESGRGLNERQHKVKLTKSFYMGISEITQGQWNRVMGEDYKGEDEMKPIEVGKGRYVGSEYPVFGVNWHEAVKFCEKLTEMEPGKTYRLPTEAEWEYACRAGTTTPFWNGKTISMSDANLDTTTPYIDAPAEKPLDRLTPVGQYAPNPWGLLDTHGNLSEWCADWGGNYKIGAVLTDPEGPDESEIDPATSYKLVRGGAFTDIPADARSAKRSTFAPITRKPYIGFRIVMEINSQQYADQVLSQKAGDDK